MITIRKNKVYFKGKDSKQLKEIAEYLGLTPQEAFTGLMWEFIMREARNGTFTKNKKA